MAAAAAFAAGGCAGCAKWQRRVGVGVGVVLVDPLGARGGSAPAVLVGLRKGSHGSGQWALPGGWLERGESLLGCALRELAEETGVAGGELLADARGARGRVLDVAPCTNLEFGSLSVFVVAAMGPGRAAAAPPRVTEPDKCLAWRWVELDGSAAEALRDLGSAGAAAGVAGEPQLFAPLEHLLCDAREALQRETRRWLGDVQGRCAAPAGLAAREQHAPAAPAPGAGDLQQQKLIDIYSRPDVEHLEEGLSVADAHNELQRLGFRAVSEADVKKMVESLRGEGHLYSTTDELHYKSTRLS